MHVQGSPFIIINYYASDKENDQPPVLNEINQPIDELDVEQNAQIIWGGDFNIPFDYSLIQMGENPKLKAKLITKIMSMIFTELDFLLHSALPGDKTPLNPI